VYPFKKSRKAEIAALTVLLVVLHSNLAEGQTPPTTILTIDITDVVDYQADLSDPAKLATNPNATPAVTPKNFFAVTLLGDIATVNGQPVKGIYAGRSRPIITSPAPDPGRGIADVVRTAMRETILEILNPDGTPIGTIMGLGFSGGTAPPGLSSANRGNWAIVGGTGAFLGARGQFVQRAQALERVIPRAASMAEDPANRRIHGGGMIRLYVYIIPMSVPQILTAGTGPALTHSSDFSLVTSSKPAAAGEVLSLFATGLGPTVPAVDPGQPFPSTPAATVNSPVEVKVNGRSAEVLGAVGFPGAVDGYQVNFRVPQDTAKGVATIQVSAAWIAGAQVSIPVQ